ncbi:MAG: hypothetical protein V4563_18110 [Pseudomonadota bacterium]
MAKTDANADDYAARRVNIFFPGNSAGGGTNQDGDLTGQCVTLEKWFTYEMCPGFPNAFGARGDARYVGQNLVRQGLAVEVPYAQRRRGDVVCLEYGVYGHIYIQLSGGRVFEENVNWAGVASRIVAGERVYASRIGSDQEAWRIAAGKNPHVYRLKSYSEGADDMIIQGNFTYDQMNRLHRQMVGNWDMPLSYWNQIQPYEFSAVVLDLSNNSNSDLAMQQQLVGENAIKDRWDLQIYSLQDQVKARDAAIAAAQAALATVEKQMQDLGSRPTQADLDAVTAQLKDAQAAVVKAQADYDQAESELKAAQAQTADDTATGNAFMRWLGGILSKLKG